VAGEPLMDGHHYFFPPARAYPLNRCLFMLKSDAGFCQRYVADREAAMNEVTLDAEMRDALRALSATGSSRSAPIPISYSWPGSG
jgi:hypothetical protein